VTPTHDNNTDARPGHEQDENTIDALDAFGSGSV